MRMLAFAGRNVKEVLRDPLNIAFGLGFPLVVLFLLTAIQANVPVPLFEIDRLAPGIAVFGLSFMALFGGMLLAKDRTTSLLLRLFASPLTPSDYLIGYALPLLPIALGQVLVCYGAAALLGLPVTPGVGLAVLVTIPAAVLFVAIGLWAGSVFTDTQVGAVCGALLTNLAAWLSGTWFDVGLVGGWFERVAYVLPFAHAVDAGRAAIAGDLERVLPHLAWVVGYALVVGALAVGAFHRRMQGDRA